MGSQSHPFTTITAFAELSRSGVNENVCIGIAKLLATTNSMELFTAIGFLLSKPGIAEILANGPKQTSSSTSDHQSPREMSQEALIGMADGIGYGWDNYQRKWVPLDPTLDETQNPT